jgi:hypothetical protein
MDHINTLEILSAIDARRLISLRIGESPKLSQCMIAGADIDANALLIEAIYPELSPLQRAHMETMGFWLQIPCEKDTLFIECRALCWHGKALSVNIENTFRSPNRRWYSRVHFKHHKGPRMSILPDHSAQISGFIRNMSRHGGAIDFWNKDLRSNFKLRERYEPVILFNEHFQMQTPIEIMECRLSRSPCSHTHIRFRMPELSALECMQLQQFIDSCRGPAAA